MMGRQYIDLRKGQGFFFGERAILVRSTPDSKGGEVICLTQTREADEAFA
jgi:hypothetical protein